MCYDIAHKTPTEIDFLGGKVVQYGRELGIPTPFYIAMTNLVKAMEDALFAQATVDSLKRGGLAMSKSNWIHVGAVLRMNASNYPKKVGWQDAAGTFTFEEWNGRANRIANGLQELGRGLRDTFAVISYNRGEWMDIYAGCAKGGQVVVPIMFRLAGPEIDYIVNHAECKGFIVEAPFVELMDSIRDRLPVPEDAYIYLGDGPTPEGYVGYEELLARSSPDEPDSVVSWR